MSIGRELRTALTKFSQDKGFKGQGPLCVALVVTQHAREMGLPLDAGKLVTEGGGQVLGLGRGAVSGGFFTRDTVVTDSESFSATTVSTIASNSWCTVAFVIRPHVVNNEVYITTSANITAGGEATTARLTAPSGKTTSDFVTGRRWDDENGTDTINITSDDYTEVEWLVALSSAPVDTDYFEFRVYAGATALYAYTLTPKWTVGTGGGGAASRQSLMMMGMGR